jgi:hypothetical protein
MIPLAGTLRLVQIAALPACAAVNESTAILLFTTNQINPSKFRDHRTNARHRLLVTMESRMTYRKYRSLEQECRVQALITTHPKTKEELKKMEREYKVIADLLESRQQTPQQAASE